jgi:hypothetical protein
MTNPAALCTLEESRLKLSRRTGGREFMALIVSIGYMALLFYGLI